MTRSSLQPLSVSWHFQDDLTSLLISINNILKALFYNKNLFLFSWFCFTFRLPRDFLWCSDFMHWQSLCPSLIPDPTINLTLKSTDTKTAPNTSLPWTGTSYRCCPAEGSFRLCLHLFNKKLYKIAEIKTGHGTFHKSSALMSVTKALISERCSCVGTNF